MHSPRALVKWPLFMQQEAVSLAAALLSSPPCVLVHWSVRRGGKPRGHHRSQASEVVACKGSIPQ